MCVRLFPFFSLPIRTPMRPLLLALPLLLPAALPAQAPTFQWAATVPNVSTPGEFAGVGAVAMASDGSAYVCGGSNGPRTIVADTLVGGTYLARFDAGGHCLWARSPGGRALAVTANDAVYVVGAFSGSLVFGSQTLNAAGRDAFVAKYAANGQPLWARQMGGALDDAALGVAVDGLGRVHVCGYFRGTGTFGSTTLTATHDSTGFQATYDASGTFQWAVRAGGFTAWYSMQYLDNAITADADGNSYMAGNFTGTGSFGSTSLSTTDLDNLYVARFAVDGTCTWAHLQGSSRGNTVAALGLDPSGDAYVYGAFRGTTATYGATTVDNSDVAGIYDELYLARYRADGTVPWARTVAGEAGIDEARGLDLDAAGHLWVTGNLFDPGQLDAFPLSSGPFLASFDGAGTALSADNVLLGAQPVLHASGASGDHFLCGSMVTASVQLDAVNGSTISPSLGGGSEGFVAHYDSGLGFDWVQRAGLHGMALDATTGVTLDAQGNVYSTGYFTTSAILGNDTLLTGLSTNGMWLSKRDANGVCVWTTPIRCSPTLALNQQNYPAALARAPNGDLLLTGRFYGTLDLGTVQLTSTGGADLFLARFDGNGHCLWAVRDGGGGDDAAASLALAANGDILVGGSYTGSTTIAGSAFVSAGLTDGFVARYAPNGNGLWCRSYGGSSADAGTGVTVDAVGNAYITGHFIGSAVFDGLAVSGTGSSDLFVAKYDATGAVQWLTGSTGTGYKEGNAITIGSTGQLYVAGDFSGEQTICTSLLTGTADVPRPSLLCLTTDGALLWQHGLPCTAGGHALGLAARPGGDVVLAGDFSGDLTVGATTLTATGYADAWAAAFTSGGDALWVQPMHSVEASSTVYAFAVAADANTVRVGGSCGSLAFFIYFQSGGHASFAAGDPNATVFAPNGWDGFVVGYASDESDTPPFNPGGCDGTVSIREAAPADGLLLAPNPVDHAFELSGASLVTAASTVTVCDVLGQRMTVPFSITGGRIRVEAGALPAGTYVVSVSSAHGSVSRRFVKE